MKLIVLFLSIVALSAHAQTLRFKDAKKYSLGDLKDKFKASEISVWNYDLRAHEKYMAFDFNQILDDAYGEKWDENFAIKVHTKDKYTPIIEMYKFQKRFPYLAFKRSDGHKFTTVWDYKDKIIDLSPFFLIWKEDYKKSAAKRRNHWPFGVKSFELIKHPPVTIIPAKDAHKDVVWGYKNYLKQCIACHAIDGVGGTRGGEMFKKINIDKRQDLFLYQYISNAKKLNKKAQMPPFPLKIDIRKKRIKNIVSYLRYIRKRDFKQYRTNLKRKKSKYTDFMKKYKSLKQ